MRVYDWVAHHAGRTPAKPAAVDLASGRRFCWAAFDDRVGRLAAGLAKRHGVGRGDRVAVLAHNSTDVFELQFACWRLGAVFVPLNWRLAAAELAPVLALAEPRVLLHGPEFADIASGCGLPGAALIAMADGADSPYERLIKGATGRPRMPADLALDDAATILFTSGTTGRPKGVIVTHGMTFWNTVNLGLPSEVDRHSVHLTSLPLFHTAGLNAYGNVVFHAGGTNVVMRQFDPALMLEHLQHRGLGLTHAYTVPAGWQFMAQDGGFARADFGRLRIAGTGGSPCARSLLETWAGKGVPLQQGYGMTETSPTVMLLDIDQAVRKLGSAGLPALHTEVRLVDRDGRVIDAPDTVGEIEVRGPNVTPGYWRAPEATAAAFRDGWLRSGDAARRDSEGFYYIVDRWKDMFISGGENVYPAEVENVLYRLPGVAEAAVIGVPDDRWGEVGLALLVPGPGAVLDAAAVQAFCRQHLAGYKVPRHVRLRASLPRTATGKVLKHVLRAEETSWS